jgi:hypothetical protein
MAATTTPGSSAIMNKYMWRFNENADIYASTKVGINIDTPTTELEVAGTIKSTVLDADMVITDGVQTKSDMRLKNVMDALLPTDCLRKVNDLDVVNYVFKDKPETLRAGFIAQQVKSVMDEAVSLRPSGDLSDCHFIDTTAIIAYLAGSVQELSKQVSILQKLLNYDP